MTLTKLKLKTPYRNVDEVSISDNLFKLQDLSRDEIGAVAYRPGLETFLDLGTNEAVDGFHWFDFYGKGVAVSDGRVFVISDRFGTFSEISGTGTLAKGVRCTFAEQYDGSNNLLLYIANGADLIYTDLSTYAKHPDWTHSRKASHIAAFRQRLLTNDTGSARRDLWYATAAGDAQDFTTGDSFSAESQPDDILALNTSNDRIFLYGRARIEVWANVTGAIPFRPETVISSGIFSGDSLVDIDGVNFYVNDRREVTALKQYTTTNLSLPIDRDIQALSYVDDVRIDRVTSVQGKNWILANFPTSQRTFAYNLLTQEWEDWGFYAGATYGRYLGQNYIFSKKWGLNLIGSRRNGKIYKISNSVYQDDGEAIRGQMTTGNIDHGTGNLKRCRMLRVTVKRGTGKTGDTGTAPKMYLQYRDDRESLWSNNIELDLGILGDRNAYEAEIYGLGMYRSRQWRITFADNADLQLVELSEDVTEVKR